jgi:hypothetical protein
MKSNRTERTQRRVAPRYLFLLGTLLFLQMICGPLPAFSQLDNGHQENDDMPGLSADNPAVQHVMRVQDRVTEAIMGADGVVGIGTGMTTDGIPAIVIFTMEGVDPHSLPEHIEGIPVVTYATGMPAPLVEAEMSDIRSERQLFAKTTNFRLGRATRPVPIGYSTGNANDCSAGTIGVRVKRGDDYFILSNNHIFARTNSASINELILQPGRGDVSCTQTLGDSIGRLVDYETIVHSTSANNLMDAALVKTDPWTVDNQTPNDGYGRPSSTLASLRTSMSVKKYGKATGLTTASVVSINATVNMNYAAGTTRFVNQIVTHSSTSFVGVGDSGSLVVTDNNQNRPVGLVFGASGSYTFVNPISAILSRFNVSIDNETSSPLPVELTSFSGRLHETDVQLKWQTATELHNFGFHVQRSTDKNRWEDLGFVQGAGTSLTPRSYDYTDRRVVDILGSGTVFYRLLQVDIDGTQDYSSIVEVTSSPMPVQMQVYPHPVRNDATVQLRLADAGEGAFSVYDATGRRLDQLSRSVPGTDGMQLLPLSMGSLPAGQYFIEYRNEHSVVRQRILLIQ